MSRSSVAFAVWAAFLALLALVLWLVFRPSAALSFVLPAFAVAGTLACALAAFVGARRPREPAPERALSASSAMLGIGLGLAVLGLALGAWLVLMAAVPVALGLFGVIREGAR